MSKILIKSDGGSRGNPGPAAIGFVVYKNQEKIKSYKSTIGVATNNTAEYKAIIEALKWLSQNTKLLKEDNPLTIECQLDSKLVVNQLNKNFKIKQAHLKKLANQAYQLMGKINQQIIFKHIKREYNQEADSLLNQAFDQIE